MEHRPPWCRAHGKVDTHSPAWAELTSERRNAFTQYRQHSRTVLAPFYQRYLRENRLNHTTKDIRGEVYEKPVLTFSGVGKIQ